MSFLVVYTLVLILAGVANAAENKKPVAVKPPDFNLKADLLDIKNPSTMLYKFEKTVTKSGVDELVDRRFSDLSGNLIAEEKLTYKNGSLQKLDLVHKQIEQSGSLAVNGNTLTFSYTKEGKPKTSDETLDGILITTDQIYGFLNNNWDKLMKGETLNIRLPVLDRLETVGFKFFQEKEADVDGIKTIVIKMKPSSFVIAALVDPVMFYFHPTDQRPDGHKLIEIVGRTVPKRKDGDKWEDLDVIMKFRY
ncbi:MAG TPA: hypothetical protein ACFYEC_04520 [Candidatus Brocadiaceae bacterium]